MDIVDNKLVLQPKLTNYYYSFLLLGLGILATYFYPNLLGKNIFAHPLTLSLILLFFIINYFLTKFFTRIRLDSSGIYFDSFFKAATSFFPWQSLLSVEQHAWSPYQKYLAIYAQVDEQEKKVKTIYQDYELSTDHLTKLFKRAQKLYQQQALISVEDLVKIYQNLNTSSYPAADARPEPVSNEALVERNLSFPARYLQPSEDPFRLKIPYYSLRSLLIITFLSLNYLLYAYKFSLSLATSHATLIFISALLPLILGLFCLAKSSYKKIIYNKTTRIILYRHHVLGLNLGAWKTIKDVTEIASIKEPRPYYYSFTYAFANVLKGEEDLIYQRYLTSGAAERAAQALATAWDLTFLPLPPQHEFFKLLSNIFSVLISFTMFLIWAGIIALFSYEPGSFIKLIFTSFSST